MIQRKRDILILLGPAALLFSLFIFYPVIRTVIMSFFRVNTVTSAMNTWEFVGFENYAELFIKPIFKISLNNIVKIWAITGVGTISISLLFAVIISSPIKGKNFFKSMVYLPEVISPLAVGYAWLLYVFNSRFGLFNQFFSFLGLDGLAAIEWTAENNIIWAMCIAAIFGAIGQYTLMYLSAIQNIPRDYYEVAIIEGQNQVKQFFEITLPLIIDVVKSSLVLFTTSTIGFFAFARVFSSINTITPMLFTYNQIFGTEINPETNVGVGAASGVIMTLVGMLFFVIINVVVRDTDYKY